MHNQSVRTAIDDQNRHFLGTIFWYTLFAKGDCKSIWFENYEKGEKHTNFVNKGAK